MIVGGYSLNLYCDGEAHGNSHFSEFKEYFNDSVNCYHVVRKEAREDGWILKQNGTALCPKCSKKKIKPKKDIIQHHISVTDLLNNFRQENI